MEGLEPCFHDRLVSRVPRIVVAFAIADGGRDELQVAAYHGCTVVVVQLVVQCFVLSHGNELVELCSGMHIISVVPSGSLTRGVDGSGGYGSSGSGSGSLCARVPVGPHGTHP